MRIRQFEPLHPAQPRSDCPRRLQKRRTIRTEILSRWEELIELRDESWTIDELGQAYREQLETAGWPCVSRAYLIKLISEVSKDAFPLRRSAECRDPVPESPRESIDGLIPVFRANIDGADVDAVNARDLHAFLEVGKDFSTWIKNRIDQFGFIENQDVVVDSPNLGNQNGRGGDRRSKDYILTLGMAKELAMVQNNAKGREARRYFIEIERRYYAGERPANPSAAQIPDAGSSGNVPEPLPKTDRDDARSWEAVLDALFSGDGAPGSEAEGGATFLDELLPVPFLQLLKAAQGLYEIFLATNPGPKDLAKLRRKAIEEAARMADADLDKILDVFGGTRRRFWIV
jgi:phage anti-repressor protein